MAVSPSRARRASEPEAVRRAVLRLRRGVQRLMQTELRACTGGGSPALERYQREYLREFQRHHQLASFGDLVQSLLERDLVFIGDYHTLRQSQDLARRLLERAAADRRPLTLALEMVLQEHQSHLDAYMQGRTGETEFLERIQYRRTWNFAWENYKPLLDAARELDVPVVGVNHRVAPGRNSLRQRDEAIAASLVEAILERPAARLMVLIGDMHLAAPHLPKALDVRLEARHLQRRSLVVFQNSDSLYWTLAERGAGTRSQVVRLGADRFCVMEVPPYVKLQSYLGWERALEDLAGVEDPDEGSALDESTSGLLQALVRQLCHFFEVPPVVAAWEVFTSLDEHFFAAIESNESLPPSRAREIHLLAFANRSVTVPELELVYLPFFSVNHAAEEAMHVLQHCLVGPAVHERDASEAFYARAWDAAMGFFGSRLVNPHRRAVGEDELRHFLHGAARRLREPQLAFRKVVARFVLQHKDHEQRRLEGGRGRLKQIYEQDLDVTLEVTYALGSMLGERLAELLLAGRLSRDSLREHWLGAPARGAAERYFGALRLAAEAER